MKYLFGFLALAFASSAFSAEKVIISRGDLAEVNKLLEAGWTVKHQSTAIAGAAARTDMSSEFKTLIVFTLVSPSDEVLQAAEKKRKEEFEAKRQEYLRNKQ